MNSGLGYVRIECQKYVTHIEHIFKTSMIMMIIYEQ
jgi:hypothetical protein